MFHHKRVNHFNSLTVVLLIKFHSTVVPGFKELGPSTALSSLNPRSALNQGTLLLSHMEIVFILKVDLNNPISVLKELKRIGENLINF